MSETKFENKIANIEKEKWRVVYQVKDVYTDRDVVATLLSKETEISNKFHNAVSEVLRLGYNTERGKKIIPELISSVQYSLEDIDRVSSKYNK